MTQDEIIEMARQAGMYGLVEGGLIKEFEAFAKLVAAKEHEHYMQLFLDPENQPTQFGTATQEYREREIKEEREACAKLVDDIELKCITDDVDDPSLKEVVKAIRARGEA